MVPCNCILYNINEKILIHVNTLVRLKMSVGNERTVGSMCVVL